MASVTSQQLHAALDKYFNLSEIRTLCFDLSIPYEDFGGEGKKEKAAELVQYAERFGKFDQVVAYVQQARPHANLQESGGGSTAVTPNSSTVQSQPTGQTSHNYNFYGPVTGSAIGEGSVQAQNIAGGNITINYNEPQNRDEFAKQLAQLEALLKEAIANGEIKDNTAVEDVQDAIEEVKKPAPSSRRLKNRLEDVQEVVEGAGGVIDAARKAGSAIIKAMPIVAGLIKVAQNLF